MPISIQCSACRRGYNVDDKLAGKMVKCKGCGAAIAVPFPVADVPAVTDLSGLDGIPSLPPLPTPAAAIRKCPSCGIAVPEGGKICVFCGLNLVTGQRAEASPIPLADEEAESKRKRVRYVRTPGNQLLEQIDEILKLIFALVLFTGIIVWIVQIVKSPAGISAAALGPVALMLVLIAGFLATVTSIAINLVVRRLNFVPRHDTYVRIMFIAILPLATSMIFGWPSLIDRFGGFVALSWVISATLLFYFLRAEIVEWIASVVTALVMFALGCLAITFITSTVASATGELYADALPTGPWVSLAKGHSPPPGGVTTRAVASTSEANTPDLTNPAVNANMTPASPAPDAATPAIPAQPTKVIASATPSVTNPPAAPSIPPVVQEFVPPRKISSPLLTDIVASEPGLQGINDVNVSSMTNTHMLIVRHDDTTATIERWRINPLKLEGSVTGPYYANAPSVYSLSPKGDVLVTLVIFPRSQVELTYFDTKTPKKILQLDQLKASFSLTGFLDPIRFGIRADYTTTMKHAVQLCNALTGSPMREIATVPLAPDLNVMAVSPNGRFFAVLGQDRQIAIYNLDNGQGLKKIPVSNDLSFKVIRLCFSPDGNQLGVYAVVADTPTIMSFKMPNGEPSGSAVVSRKPRSFNADASAPARGGSPASAREPINHDLLWLASGKYWLVNGNEIIDVATGTKAGVLDLEGVTDQYLAGTDSIIFAQSAPDNKRNVVVARISEDQIKAGAGKIR